MITTNTPELERTYHWKHCHAARDTRAAYQLLGYTSCPESLGWRSMQFLVADTVDEALGMLWEEGDDLRVLAGGTDVMIQPHDRSATSY